MSECAECGAAKCHCGIPDFLVLTPQEAARRQEYNATHPVVAMPFSLTIGRPKSSVIDEDEWLRGEAEREARAKAASYDRLAKMKSGKEAKAAAKAGMRWDNNRWVRADGMTRARFIRLLGEMPTAEHRKTLHAMYDEAFPGVRDDGEVDVPANKAAPVVTRKRKVKA